MARIGETHCRNTACSCKDVAVNKTAANNLTMTCHKCGFPTFAKAGTRWRRDFEATVRMDDDQAGAPAPDPSSAPAAPAPAPRPSTFLG